MTEPKKPRYAKPAPTRGAKPGERRAGRAKGTPNKVTKQLKDMILAALELADSNGSVAYLTKQAGDNPVAFLALVGKVLPLQVQAEHKGTLVAEVIFRGLND